MQVDKKLGEASSSCARIFNSTVVAAAISAAWELGVLDELHHHSKLDVAAFSHGRGLHEESVRAILAALASQKIVESGRDWMTLTPGPCFDEVYQTKGFFYWLTRGCGELFSTLAAKAPNDARVGGFIRRDMRAIGIATQDIGESFVDPLLRSILDRLSFATVADLGCGSGHRLACMATTRPDFRGIGIDIAPAALAVARETVQELGLVERIQLVQADATALTPQPEFTDVELVTCFFMGHDFWPRDNCVDSLKRLRTAFPRIQHFLLGDTYRSDGLADAQLPIFTLGFELAHAVMGQYVPTLTEWIEAFDEAGWECVEQYHIDPPPFTVIFHARPAVTVAR
jgi:phenylpyruvate C(3)-methyltransferase